MNKSRHHRPLISLLAAMAISMAALASTPAHACGGPYNPPSESTQASWAVRAHLVEQRQSIKRVNVQLGGKNNAAAVVQFNEKSKLPPLLLRLVKKDGGWKVVSTSWRA